MKIRALTTLVTTLSIGWLSSGSCHVSYCDEDCDPCIQQCRCHTSICYQSSAAWLAVRTLTRYELVETPGVAGDRQRVFSDIQGLSVQRAGGPPVPAANDVVAFARDVLIANPAHFGRDASAFALLDVVACESGNLVRFQRSREGRATDLVTFLFDPRGGLAEIAHDARD
jgi:hypothetical protein